MRVVQELEGGWPSRRHSSSAEHWNSILWSGNSSLFPGSGLMGGQRDESGKTRGQDHKGPNATWAPGLYPVGASEERNSIRHVTRTKWC